MTPFQKAIVSALLCVLCAAIAEFSTKHPAPHPLPKALPYVAKWFFIALAVWHAFLVLAWLTAIEAGIV